MTSSTNPANSCSVDHKGKCDEKRANIEVKPLRREDVHQAAQTLFEGSVNDPMYTYMRDTPDARPAGLYNRIERIQFRLFVSMWARKKWGYVVDHGKAVMSAPPATNDKSKDKKVDKFLDFVNRLVARILNFVGKSKLQRKRFEQTGTTLYTFLHENIGDEIKDTRAIFALRTAPACEGCGYDEVLLDYITKLADSEGRPIHVFSTTPAYTKLYQSYGFEKVAEVQIGKDDSTWERPPIPVVLLVRKQV